MNTIINRRQFGLGSLAGAAVISSGGGVALLTGCSSSWITTLENDLPQLVSIASSIISIVALAQGNGALPAALAPDIAAAAAALKTSLQDLQSAVTAYNNGKGSGTLAAVTDALIAVQTSAQNVIAALPAGSVSTPTETAIIAGIGLLITLLSSVQLLMPGGAPAPAVAKARARAVVERPSMPDAATIRTGFNAVLQLHGFESAMIK